MRWKCIIVVTCWPKYQVSKEKGRQGKKRKNTRFAVKITEWCSLIKLKVTRKIWRSWVKWKIDLKFNIDNGYALSISFFLSTTNVCSTKFKWGTENIFDDLYIRNCRHLWPSNSYLGSTDLQNTILKKQ